MVKAELADTGVCRNGGGALAGSVPTTEVSAEELNEDARLLAWVAKVGLCKSNGEARRLIQGGGAYLNDQRISDPDFTAKAADFPNGSAIVKAGKKNIKRIVLK